MNKHEHSVCPECFAREGEVVRELAHQRDRMRAEVEYRVRREVDYEVERRMYKYTHTRDYYRLQDRFYLGVPMETGMDMGTRADSTTYVRGVSMSFDDLLVAHRQLVTNLDRNGAQGVTDQNMNAIAQLMAANEPPKEEEKSMNVVKKIKALALSKEDKLLRKYGIVDDAADLTTAGKDALWTILLETNKTALVGKLQEIETESKGKSNV